MLRERGGVFWADKVFLDLVMVAGYFVWYWCAD
jgi:hypothetical protein